MGDLYMRFPDGSEMGIDHDGETHLVFEHCDKCDTRKPRAGGRDVRDRFGELLLWFCRECELKATRDTRRT